MTASSMSMVELAIEVGRLDERLKRVEQRLGEPRDLDERIESALAAERAGSLGEYIDGRRDGGDSAPQVLDVEPGPVQAGPAVADGLLGPNLDDSIRQFTHNLAPSVGPEGSVGASPARGSASSTGDDATGGES